jgi:molecular chaperone HscC
LAAVVVNGKARVLPNGVGEPLTPSAVHVAEDGSVWVGAAARLRATTHAERTALAFKRDMGTNRVTTLGGKQFRPEELSALVLGAIKRDVEAELGPIEEAVVTVPAYFGELQRQATRDACEMAGLRVERIINEPTAAALAYGLHERHRELSAVVLDLGGGTFDVAVLEIIEGIVEIQASAGDTRLGGEDFLDLVVAQVEKRLNAEDGLVIAPGAQDKARLRQACEDAKCRLSSEEVTRVVLPQIRTNQGVRDIEISLARGEIEQAFAPLLERLMGPVQRALRDAGRSAQGIQEVLLVGGATRMPCVVRLAAQVFGRLALRALPPDEAVALGAAVQVALKAGDEAVGDLVVTDIAPFSLGIATSVETGGTRVPGIFSPIIERGTVLPASRVERFSTVGDRQRHIELEVYQGEHSLCSDNQRIGQYTLKDIPPAPAGVEAVDVRFSYDMNGVLDVDATVVSTGKTAIFTIQGQAGRLSRREVEQARARLARLKFHPRDALPNTLALARADTLFVELVGKERDQLGGALAAFRGALESQDAKAIDELRELLLAVVLSLSRRPR